VYADVFIDGRPVNSVTGADDLKALPLRPRGLGEPPRPRERDADRASIGQADDDGVLGDFKRDYAGITHRSAH
jgi:hypothetical protein